MPKRTDLKTILIIGSGPIVIGQGCEFDYSGTQACKALREEGYQVVLINSNPATIMTDPEFADATYIEPITPAGGREDHRQARGHRPAHRRGAAHARRPDRAQLCLRPRRGGNVFILEHGVEMIGANREVIYKRRGPAASVQRHHGFDRPRRAPSPASPTRWKRRSGRRRPARRNGTSPRSSAPAFTLGGTGGGIAYNREEFEDIVRRGLDALPVLAGAHRGVAPRLEGVRDGGDARQGRQRGHHLLPSRTSTRWACTPATRSPSPPPRR